MKRPGTGSRWRRAALVAAGLGVCAPAARANQCAEAVRKLLAPPAPAQGATCQCKFEGPEPSLQLPAATPLKAAIAHAKALKPGETLPPGETRTLLQWIAGASREALLKASFQADPAAVFSPTALFGKCGPAQASAAFAAEKLGLPPGSIRGHQAREVFGGGDGHAFVTVDMPDGKTYLVDTSVRQFFDPKRAGDIARGGAQVRRDPKLSCLADQLMTDGFVELTPEASRFYGIATGGRELWGPVVDVAVIRQRTQPYDDEFERGDLPVPALP